LTCCARATEDELREQPEAFQCETCEFRIRKAELTLEDQTALDVYRQLSLRVVRDLALTPLVFDIAGLRLTHAEACRLLDRLDVIHQDTTWTSDEPQSDDRD
jgi:hypothetical protein